MRKLFRERIPPYVALWALRIATFALPLTYGSGLETWLKTHVRHDPVVVVFAWAAWVLLALAVTVAHPISRTVAHVLALATFATALLIAPIRNNAFELANVLVVTALVFWPEVNNWWINGTAYPNERRYMLRMPSLIAFGPLVLAYTIVIGAPLAAISLLSNGHYVAGTVATLVGAFMVAVCARAIHQLGRRWIVFVPAGVVLHDPMSLTDPVLFERAVIEKLAPAPADTDALDLTQAALGMSIELDLTEKVPMALAKPLGQSESGASARLMFTPAQPGAVLTEAARRKLPR